MFRNLLVTVSNCLKRERVSCNPNSNLISTPVALVSFVHRPTLSGEHTADMDLEFFEKAQSEFGLSSILLDQRTELIGEENETVYLYGMYYNQ